MALVDKNFGYFLEAAGSPAEAPMVAAAYHVFSEAISRGLGKANLTGVVRLFVDA